MNYKINFTGYKSNFSLPGMIVQDLKETNSDYLKVILLIFKNPDKHYSINLLSNLLDLCEDIISDAINYWIHKNVLLENIEKIKSDNVHVISDDNTIIIDKKPNNDSELAFLVSNMETCLNRSVTSTDLKIVTYIYEYYRLPADVILMAMVHCSEYGNKSIKYLEKMCIDWYEKGIDNHDTAEEYLQIFMQRQENINKLKDKFGIANRGLIPSEEKYAAIWFDEYKYDLDMIAKAFEITIERTGKVAFAYTNKILENWHNNGYKTLDDVNDSLNITKKTQNNNNSYDLEMLDEYWNTVPKLD